MKSLLAIVRAARRTVAERLNHEAHVEKLYDMVLSSEEAGDRANADEVFCILGDELRCAELGEKQTRRHLALVARLRGAKACPVCVATDHVGRPHGFGGFVNGVYGDGGAPLFPYTTESVLDAVRAARKARARHGG